MSKHNLKEMTRNTSWSCETSTNSDLQTSCLMRIADASELMAKNYRQLIEDAEMYRKWYYEQKAEKEHLQRKVNAYKGTVTTLQNKISKLKSAENENSDRT